MTDDPGNPSPRPRPRPLSDGESPTRPDVPPVTLQKTDPAVAPSPVQTQQPAPADPDVLIKRIRRLSWLPSIGLGVAAVVLIVLAAVVGSGVYWFSSGNGNAARDQRQQQVLAAAKTCLATLNSYDYRNLSAALQKDRACLTGPYETTFVRAFNRVVVKLAPGQKASQTVQINNSGINKAFAGGTEYKVLIYGQTSTVKTGTTAKNPDVAPFGALVIMKLVDGHWLVAHFKADVPATLTNS